MGHSDYSKEKVGFNCLKVEGGVAQFSNLSVAVWHGLLFVFARLYLCFAQSFLSSCIHCDLRISVRLDITAKYSIHSLS